MTINIPAIIKIVSGSPKKITPKITLKIGTPKTEIDALPASMCDKT